MNVYQKYFIGLIIATASFLIYKKYRPTHDSQHGAYQLRLGIDTSARFYLDYFAISANHSTIAGKNFQFDSNYGNWFQVFDSVREKDVEVMLVSHLNRTYRRKIRLTSDS